MRVLHLMAGAKRGGAEMQMVDLACALQARGVEQHVMTRANDLRVERLAAAAIPTTLMSFTELPPLWTRFWIARAIRHFKPDIVQAWMGRAAKIRLPAGPIKVGWFGGYHDLKRFRDSDYWIAITRDIQRHIAEAMPADRVRLIHQFSELAEAPPAPRAAEGTPDGVPLLLTLARLHPRKGLDTLLAAMLALPGVHLWIAGDGPLKGELEAQIAASGLGDRVRLLGWRTDRAALLKAADLFVFPSRFEPFGLVMLEAWQMGVPVVAAASQGPKDYLRDGETGLLCAVDDAAALAATVRRGLEDRDLRARMVAAGALEYAAHFTRDRIVDAYMDLYTEIGGRGAAGR